MTTLSPNRHLVSCAKSASRILSLCIILLGILVLVGWSINYETLKRISLELVAMNPLTAIAFVISGTSVLLLSCESNSIFHRLGWVLASVTMTIGLLRLFEYMIPFGFRVDQILFREKLAGNVMAPNTAFCFLLIGLSLISALYRNDKIQYLSQSLVISVFLISLLALVGYGYRIQTFYKVSLYIPMALNTAIAFSLLSISVLTMRTENGFTKIFVSDTAGGFMARRLLPAIIIIPLILGELRLMGEFAGFYTTEFGVSLFAISTIVIFFILVWWTARIINRTDVKRRQAEEALKKMFDELELRVQERTAELKQAQHQLVQQERLRALGEMAGGIAHDFNNSLSPILGYTELMLTAPDILSDTVQMMNNLKTINTAAKDAAKTVSLLRKFSRPREKNEDLNPVDLNKLVLEAVAFTQPKWKTQARIHGSEINIQTDLEQIPAVGGNESELREVLTNLIFNAIDALPKGGTIQLSTHSLDEHVLLEIIDNGIGMTEDIRRRCLEPFFTTKGEQGTGLGLSMVYGIIQRHNGTINIQSEAGNGTTFSISLPVQKIDQENTAKNTKPPQTRPLHVLFVDDDALARNVIVEYLKRDGHTVEIATNGIEGLNKFCAGEFSLVITDQAMPGMTGDKLALEIKKIAPQQPIILFSGTLDLSNLNKLPEGIDAFVNKPLTLDKLRQTIIKVMPAC
ncbi:MAG: response regulator [Candidatus Omnitrophica bacterium]|nr:response regulator [Candidatus Omnitrophota bacterium]